MTWKLFTCFIDMMLNIKTIVDLYKTCIFLFTTLNLSYLYCFEEMETIFMYICLRGHADKSSSEATSSSIRISSFITRHLNFPCSISVVKFIRKVKFWKLSQSILRVLFCKITRFEDGIALNDDVLKGWNSIINCPADFPTFPKHWCW